MRSRKNRGYWVSRQAYALGEPCFRAVEIAYSSDRSEPRENASPGELTRDYASEGYHDYPVEAVEAAKEVHRLWSSDFPAEDGDEDAVIRFTVTTGGGSFDPEVMTLEELESWASKRYNGMEKHEHKPTPLSNYTKAIIARFDRLEGEGKVRLGVEADDIPYDDSYFDSWDVCQEEIEELKDDLWKQIEQEGVWCIQAQVRHKGRWEDASPCCGGIVGLVGVEEKLAFMTEALAAYDKIASEKAERMARKLASRATYAGPSE